MTTTPPAITALPAAPDPNNRTTFNTLAYPWSAALPTFGTQVSAVGANVKANADEVITAANAAFAAGLANAATNAGTASTAASNASTAATTATTQAGIAATQAAAATAAAVGASNIVLGVSTLYPAIRPSLDLDFANGQSVDPRITFTRASTATRTNARGLIEVVASGVPRIDFDAVTGECKGLLIEGQQTNLMLYSDQFSQWALGGNAVRVGSVLCPDGASGGEGIRSNGTQGNLFLTRSVTAATSTAHTFSPWVMCPDTSLLLGNKGVITIRRIRSSVSTTFTLPQSSANLVSGVWKRLSLSVADIVVGDTVECYLGFDFVDAGNTTTTLYIWGAQLEAGAFPTSYIPTAASQVTRMADVATMTGTNFSSWYRQDEGAVIAGVSYQGQLIGSAVATNQIALDDGTINNAINIRTVRDLTTPTMDVSGVSSGATQIDTAGSFSIATGVGYTRAFGYALNSAIHYVNGVADGGVDTSFTPPVVNRLVLASGGIQAMCIRSLTYYPKRLTNTELQALSTP